MCVCVCVRVCELVQLKRAQSTASVYVLCNSIGSARMDHGLFKSLLKISELPGSITPLYSLLVSSGMSPGATLNVDWVW